MDFPKYDGNVHPDEWIDDIRKHYKFKKIDVEDWYYAMQFIDSTIKLNLPNGIDNIEKLRNALKEDISFTVFKTTNKRVLQLLKYIPEREGGKTSKFISTFRKLCYNAEINDIKEQKKYFYQSLLNNNNHYLFDLFKKEEKINSMNDLIKEFEKIIADESNLIRNESIVTLKHVATGRYLSSCGLYYTTGSKKQLIFVGNTELGPNSLWKININTELAIYGNTLTLRHIKSDKSIGLANYKRYNRAEGRYYYYYKSPITEHTEVCCCENEINWKFNHSKLENHQGYLKSNDTINLSIKKNYDDNGSVQDGQVEFLRSHDIQFTIGNDNFQEVVCHHERLGGNDEWCIELLDTYLVKLLIG